MRTFKNYTNGDLTSETYVNTNKGITTRVTNTFDNRSKLQRAMDTYSERRKQARFYGQVSSNIFTFLLGFLIIVALARTLTGVQGMPTFGSLLDKLQNMPNVDLTINVFRNLKITGDWSIFDGLRQFINTLISIASFGVWTVSGLIQVVMFAISLVGWMFGV